MGTTIKNIISLAAAIPTFVPKSPYTSGKIEEPRGCGEVSVFYTGLPPYHPLTIAQGWDPLRVEIGLRNETVNLVQAGYNVQIVWAGTEIPISTVEQRMDDTGVEYDLLATGFGLRGATLLPLIERFEDVVEMYARKNPKARKIFNYNPESTYWSAAHRMPLKEDCNALGKHGKLIGYEEICDSRCDHERAKASWQKPHGHDEL